MMKHLIGRNIACRKGSKWYLGKVGKLKKNGIPSINALKEVKKLADVPNVENYLTFLAFYKTQKFDVDEIKKLQETYFPKMNVDRIYVEDAKDMAPTAEEKNFIKKYQEYWFNNLNEKCQQCQKHCKQSCNVEIISCQMIRNV